MENTRFEFRNAMSLDQLKQVEKSPIKVVKANSGKLAFYCGTVIGAVSSNAEKALKEGDVTNIWVAEAKDTQNPEAKWVPILYVSGGIRSREVLYEL